MKPPAPSHAFPWTRITGSVLCIALLALAGCATRPYQPPVPLTGDVLIDGQTYIEQGPPRDRVLWQYRTGLHALRQSRYDLAERLFEDAILNLGAMMQPDGSARQSRRLFREEAEKTFFGEPYERVMAWYYRGILYWMNGEPDNARACFRSAQFQDADAENNTYRSDYALLDYLEGFITEKLGGDGSDSLERARTVRDGITLPDYNPDANTVVLIDFGAAPIKFAGGEYGEELRFRQGASPVKSARLTIGNIVLPVSPVDDLYYQATTRGGRVMDHVLANQAVFKKTTDTIGDAAVISGAILATNRDTEEAGLAVLGVGLISKIFASAARPEADTRYWHNLPQYLSFALLKLAPGSHGVRVDFLDGQGRVIANLTKEVAFDVTDDGPDQVIYLSDQSLSSTTEQPQ